MLSFNLKCTWLSGSFMLRFIWPAYSFHYYVLCSNFSILYEQIKFLLIGEKRFWSFLLVTVAYKINLNRHKCRESCEILAYVINIHATHSERIIVANISAISLFFTYTHPYTHSILFMKWARKYYSTNRQVHGYILWKWKRTCCWEYFD